VAEKCANRGAFISEQRLRCSFDIGPSDSLLMTGFAGGGTPWPAKLCLVVASPVNRHYCGVRICLSFDNKAGLVFTRP
jgi:hypothetical protein